MPNGVVKHLEARLLKELVNNAIHPIRCAESCRWKYQKGLRIGDLCAETGHFWWALKVWRLTAKLIENKDWDDWIDVPINSERVSLADVISETEYELLLKRCGNLLQAIGYPEAYWWTPKAEHYAERYFGLYAYRWLFAEKHCGYCFFDLDSQEWEDGMREVRARYQTEALFREGQGDFTPQGTQTVTDYWNDDQYSPLDDLAWFEMKGAA